MLILLSFNMYTYGYGSTNPGYELKCWTLDKKFPPSKTAK